MKNKYLAILVLVAGIGEAAWAAAPTITLVFTDPQGLCKNNNGDTQFAFNYQYLADAGIEYFSGPVNVHSALASIVAPPLPDDGVQHTYLDFEITSQGDCGHLDLDYAHPGACYLTNLIPAADQHSAFSYNITLTPQVTGNHTDGNAMYHLNCVVREISL